MDKEKESLGELLRKREEMERELDSKFSRELSIMITDIKGSTEYYEKHDNFSGRALLEKHNKILFPLIAENKGRVVKSTGDGALVVFERAEDAIRTGIGMQKTIEKENQGKNINQQLHVRVAINHGKVIDDNGDVYGAPVNRVARIESATEAGQIVVSEEVYKLVKNSEDIICRAMDTVKFKGVEELQRLYRVVWQPEKMQMGKVVRGADDVQKKTAKKKSFVISMTKEGERLKLSAYERSPGEHKTVLRYEEVKVDDNKLNKHRLEVIELLNRANRSGRINKEILNKLKSVGQMFYDELFSAEVKQKIAATEAEDMIIYLDDNLLAIPWELIYDGKNFLSLRFNIGRLVTTRQKVADTGTRELGLPLKMLILSDPKGDLKSAHTEGCSIRDMLEGAENRINVFVKTSSINADYVQGKVRNFDMVHYAGHSDYDHQNPEKSGWLLKDRKFMAEEILKMGGSQPMPALVFSNSCHSGQTDDWKLSDHYEKQIYGMANAFLLTGVQHYVGTFWEVLDEPSSFFALNFYKHLAESWSIGESLRLSRLALIEKYGEETIVWASYMLYGDPGFVYTNLAFIPTAKTFGPKVMKEKGASLNPGTARSEEQTIVVDGVPEKKSSKNLFVVGGVLMLLLSLGIYYFFQSSKQAGLMEKEIVKTREAIVESQKAKEAVVVDDKKKIAEKEAQEKTDKLVAELSERFKQEKTAAVQPPADAWKSRPLVISLLTFKIQGETKLGTEEFLLNRFSQAFGQSQRVQIVERALIDKLLKELHLSSSELADPQTALKIGRLVGARFIATGSLFVLGGEAQLNLKIIETETTSLVTAPSLSTKKIDDFGELVDRSVNEITANLIKAFPLRGRIVSVDPEQVIIDLGKDLGLPMDKKFKVITEENILGADNKIIGVKKIEVAQLQVTQVEDNLGYCKIISKKGDLKQGEKVEEIM